MNDQLVTCTGLTKRYGGKTALSGLNLELGRGRIVGLLGPNGRVSGGTGDGQETFFREYKFKLEGLYGRFLTRRGAQLARERQEAAVRFYEDLLREVSRPYETGPDLLAGRLE